jgi:hypothetical protein
MTDKARLKATLSKLREQRAATLEAAVAHNKQHQAERRVIKAAMKDGQNTVPAIAAATELPTNEVMLHVAGMRKYGDLVETGVDGDYPTYQLVAGDVSDNDEKKGE